MALSDGAEPISFAAGVEYRKYTAEVFADQLAQNPGELGGAGGATTPVKGGYDVREVFGEIIAPLFAGLTLEAGVRYSDYKVDDATKQKYSTWTVQGGCDGGKRSTACKILRQLPAGGSRAEHRRNFPAECGWSRQPEARPLPERRYHDRCNLEPRSDLRRAGCSGEGAGNIAAFDPPSAGQINASFNYDAPLKPEKADTFTVGAIFQPELRSEPDAVGRLL